MTWFGVSLAHKCLEQWYTHAALRRYGSRCGFDRLLARRHTDIVVFGGGLRRSAPLRLCDCADNVVADNRCRKCLAVMGATRADQRRAGRWVFGDVVGKK
jgi:hypothetical protein